ncbi:MAG TPA: dihydrolipoamide acetyltransferase family protein [Gammaproteobacteria bacterium]|nr:dihydrolipoamide acetyltransferase family protein [Gammaproteobacteria bacterium]
MDVLMPQLGETVAEGTVATWHKQEGDKVEVDEILLDVETDKVSMEIPVPKAGTLSKILVPAGETVEVGTVLGIIQGEGEAVADPAPGGKSEAAGKPDPAEPPASRAEPPAAPRDAPTVTTVRVPKAATSQKLSPAVRRLVAEHEIDIGAVPGTGRNGRVTRRNVVEFIESGSAAAAPPDARAPAAPAAAPTPAAPEARQEPAPSARPRAAAPASGRVPFNRIRKLTADHMVKSKATSPHVLQAVEVDFSGVDRVRSAVKESWKAQHGYALTYLPFIAHAVCTALKEFPNANASVGDDELILHDDVNLAIAVDLGPDGLVAPVIRRADRLSLAQLAEAIVDVAGRARSNKLKADDLSGGTYTLSNSGTFGTLITAPVINQPQVAILSIDGVRKRPVVIERPDGDSIAIRPVGILAQSFDHRAIDGAYSAAYLDRLRKLLELTDWFREI